MIPLQAPVRQYYSLESDIRAAIDVVLQSGRYLLGQKTTDFEVAFAQFCGRNHCISVGNGTDALELSLRSIGIEAQDQVMTVANAGGYTTTVCRLIGAIPVYIDVELDSLTLDRTEAIAAVTPKTRAIVATHLYGTAIDVFAMRQELDQMGRSDIAIVEDCAQAHGASVNGRQAGSMGTVASFSFYPTKNLGALGDGGAVVCQDKSIAQTLRQLRQYGWVSQYHAVTPYGRNSRLDELQAAILLEKLPHVLAWNQRRREIIQAYQRSAPSGFRFVGSEDPGFAAHLCIGLHPERDRIREQLHNDGVMTGIHYPVLDFDQPCEQSLDRIVHDVSNSQLSNQQIFTLPCFPELTDAEVEHICSRLRLF